MLTRNQSKLARNSKSSGTSVVDGNKTDEGAVGDEMNNRKDAMMYELRKVIFKEGIVLDNIMKGFVFDDNRSLQLVNKEFTQVVVGHKSWNLRRVIVTKRNASDIAKNPPMRVWTSAKVELLLKRDFKALGFLWRELVDFWAINSSVGDVETGKFSRYLLRDVLRHAGNLTTLKISANLLCGSTHAFLTDLSTVLWSKLIHFEICFDEEHNGENMYDSFVYGNSDMSKSFFQTMSAFQWNVLETFILGTAEEVTRPILSNDFLQNVRILELNTSSRSDWNDAVWTHMMNIHMPNLSQLNTKILSSSPQVHRNFRVFFDNHPHLKSLNLRVTHLKAVLFEVNEDQLNPYLLKAIQITFENSDRIPGAPFPFGLLSKFTQLEAFNFEGLDNYHQTWPPQPSLEEAISILPSSLMHLTIRICTINMLTSFDRQLKTREYLKTVLQKQARLQLPNLRTNNIDLCTCHACSHRIYSPVDGRIISRMLAIIRNSPLFS